MNQFLVLVKRTEYNDSYLTEFPLHFLIEKFNEINLKVLLSREHVCPVMTLIIS